MPKDGESGFDVTKLTFTRKISNEFGDSSDSEVLSLRRDALMVWISCSHSMTAARAISCSFFESTMASDEV